MARTEARETTNFAIPSHDVDPKYGEWDRENNGKAPVQKGHVSATMHFEKLVVVVELNDVDGRPLPSTTFYDHTRPGFSRYIPIPCLGLPAQTHDLV